MYTLKESTEYALSTEGKCNKTFLFVKLTDSALQSILSLKSQEDTTVKPTIQFENDKGTLSLPVNGGRQNYNFTLSNVETNGLQGSFQCIKHAEDRSLESLGDMLMKIQIKAKEDSYEQTKFKLAVANQEQKSFCTKEIKPNGAHRTHKVRIRNSGPISSSEIQQPIANKTEVFKHPNLLNRLTVSVLQGQPLKKRIIHILAVKSYKKPDLLLRLMKDGINEAEKKEFNTLLPTVATLKGNVYNLHNHLWKEVEDDWKFCSKQELQLIHRRKQQFLRPINENDSHDSSEKIPIVHKNNASESSSIELEPLNKKRRISHFAVKNSDETNGSDASGQISSSEIKFPSLNIQQKLTNSLPTTNGSYDNTNQKSVNGFHTSQKLKKNSGDQITNHKNIHNSNLVMPSTDISSVSGTFKSKKSRFEDSKSSLTKFLADHHLSNGSLQNRKNSVADLLNSVSSVQKGASSYRFGEKLKYETCKNNSTPLNSNNHPVFDISNMVSPITSDNTFFSSLPNKESKNHVDCYAWNSVLQQYDDRTLILVQGNEKRSVIYAPKLRGNLKSDIYSGAKDSSIVNVVSEFNCTNIIKEYPPIKSKEQRSQYAKEFDSHYEDYLKLHTQMRDVSEKFIDLENKLETYKEGSREYKTIRAKMHLEYTLIIQNVDYINAWKKFNILQSKLSHIKRMIKEYDISCCEEC